MQNTESSSLEIKDTVSLSIQSKESTNPLEPTQLAAFCREHDTLVWFYFGVGEELASKNLLDASNDMRLYACVKDQFAFQLKILPNLQDTSIQWRICTCRIGSEQNNRAVYLLRIGGLQSDQYKLITQHVPNAAKNSHDPITKPDKLATLKTEQDEIKEFVHQLSCPAMHMTDDDEILLIGAPLGDSKKIEDALLSNSLFKGSAVTSLIRTHAFTVTTGSNEEAKAVHHHLQQLSKRLSAEPRSSKP